MDISTFAFIASPDAGTSMIITPFSHIAFPTVSLEFSGVNNHAPTVSFVAAADSSGTVTITIIQTPFHSTAMQDKATHAFSITTTDGCSIIIMHVITSTWMSRLVFSADSPFLITVNIMDMEFGIVLGL